MLTVENIIEIAKSGHGNIRYLPGKNATLELTMQSTIPVEFAHKCDSHAVLSELASDLHSGLYGDLSVHLAFVLDQVKRLWCANGEQKGKVIKNLQKIIDDVSPKFDKYLNEE